MLSLDEADVLLELRRGYEVGLINEASVSRAGEAIAQIVKEEKMSSKRLTELLEQSFTLERQLETAQSEATWSEEQVQQSREAQLQKIYQLQADVRASEREVAAAQAGTTVIEEDIEALAKDVSSAEEERYKAFLEKPDMALIKEESRSIQATIQLDSTNKDITSREVGRLKEDLQERRSELEIQLNVVHEEQAESARSFPDSDTEKRRATIDGLKLRRQEAAAQRAAVVTELAVLEQHVQKLRVASAVPRREVAAESLALQQAKKVAQKGHISLIEWKEKIDTFKAENEDLLDSREKIEASLQEAQIFMRAEINKQNNLHSRANHLVASMRVLEDKCAETKDLDAGLMSARANLEHESHSQERSLRQLSKSLSDAGEALESCRTELTQLKAEGALAAKLLRDRSIVVQNLEDVSYEEARKVLLRQRQIAEYHRLADKVRSNMKMKVHGLSKLIREHAEEDMLIQVLHAAVKVPEERFNQIAVLHNLLKNQRNQFAHVLQAAQQSMLNYRHKSKAARHERTLAEKLVQEKQTELDHGKRLLQTSRTRSQALHRDVNMTHQRLTAAMEEHTLLQAGLCSLENECHQIQMTMRQGQQQTLAAAQQRQDYKDAVKLIEESVARLKLMVASYDNILADGELASQKLADEQTIYKRRGLDLQRKLALACAVKGSSLADMDVAVVQRQAEILIQAARSSEFAALLESTNSGTRWRHLGGVIPSQEEAKARLTQLGRQWEQKLRMLESLDLILGEFTSLTTFLTNKAVTHVPYALELSKQINRSKRMGISIDRQFLAALGEGTLFTDLEEQWAGKYASTRHSADIVKATKDMHEAEVLAVDARTTILSIG